MTRPLPAWRSLLFVPVLSERFLPKAHMRGADALILDLEERGMLDETLVLWISEHGRTPKIDSKPIGAGRHHWSRAYSVALAGGGIAYGLVNYVKTPSGRARWDDIRIKLPIFGQIAHKIVLARFARTLSSMVRSGVPILEVLNIVANTSGHVGMEKAIRSAASEIERGEGLSTSLAKSPLFPTMIIRMLSAGEQTGKIDAMLERVADFLDDEIETILDGLTSLIEPLLIVFLGVTVGSIVIAMFLPIFKMSDIINPPGR